MVPDVKNSASEIRLPGSKAEPTGRRKVLQVRPSLLRAAEKYDDAIKTDPFQIIDVTEWLPTLVPVAFQVTPESVDQWRAPAASAPTVMEEFFAATTMLELAVLATAEGRGTPAPKTPVTTTAADMTVVRASFNHRFILASVWAKP
jgi:hypothetical protein